MSDASFLVQSDTYVDGKRTRIGRYIGPQRFHDCPFLTFEEMGGKIDPFTPERVRDIERAFCEKYGWDVETIWLQAVEVEEEQRYVAIKAVEVPRA